MKFKINDKIQFIDLAEHIKHGKSYNVTILEAKVRETGFTDRQLEQIGKIVTTIIATTVPQIIAKTVPQIIATTVPPLIEAALVPIRQEISEIKRDLKEVRELPVIKEALQNGSHK